MASIGSLTKRNHQFILVGRRFYNNPDQPPDWPKMNVTETKIWFFHNRERLAACAWADRMAALRFGCQLIDIDQGFRVYENNWQDINAHYENRIRTAQADDATYAQVEQRCVDSELHWNKVVWPRRSGVLPKQEPLSSRSTITAAGNVWGAK